MDYIAGELFDYYENAAKDCELRQKQAFQILFDTKYVTLLMVSRENKKLVERSMQACNNVLAKIDPFDSDVFYPFIHTNVKKSVQRTLVRKTVGNSLTFSLLNIFFKLINFVNIKKFMNIKKLTTFQKFLGISSFLRKIKFF